MKINTLSLSQYRNYTSFTGQFRDGLNVIVGQNGQGKTNLLESIYFLSTLRSFRTTQDKDLIQFDEDYFRINAEIFQQDSLQKYQLVVLKTGKSIKVNNTILKKSSDYLGLVNCVLFSPQDLSFFSDSPKVRRKFLDIESTKLSKKVLTHLNNYYKVLKERNALLKQTHVDEALLDILTQQLIDDMFVIVNYRSKLIEFLNQRTHELFNKISHKDHLIEFKYQTEINETDEQLFKELMLNKMNQNKSRDILFKMTHSGAHRDDLVTLMDSIDINSIASQGQKRLVLLAMKLALIEFIVLELNEPPILLLDDVFSELDSEHQQRFIDFCPQSIQTIITTTSVLDLKQEMTIFEIKNGQLETRRTQHGEQ